jgi:hypothetical protein
MSTGQHFASHDEFVAFLRSATGWRGDEPPFDTVGLFHAFLALLDNLRENALPAEVADLCSILSPDQIAFLRTLSSTSNEQDTKVA